MKDLTFLEPIIAFVTPYALQIALTLALALVYLLVDRFATPRLTEGAEEGRFKEGSADKAIRVARLLMGLTVGFATAAVWGIDPLSILVFAGTTLTLLGVAFFASWSLLSHVTAYFILLLHPTFRRGVFIRIFEMDNYIEGYIADITMFNVKMITENREIIVYPNSLLLGRPALINPRDRRNTVGKIDEPIRDESDSVGG